MNTFAFLNDYNLIFLIAIKLRLHILNNYALSSALAVR